MGIVLFCGYFSYGCGMCVVFGCFGFFDVIDVKYRFGG